MYGSAEYLEKKMRDWSDDVFFLELWDELQDRARTNNTNTANNNQRTLAGPNMTVATIAERTSSAVGSQTDTSGALFDETASAYTRLRIRAENLMTDLLTTTFRDTLRPYGRINPWSSLSLSITDSESSTPLSLTAELDATIEQLDEYLSFLSKVLAQAPLRRIVRQAVLAMQAFLYDHVMLRYTFSTSGAQQFQRDVEVVWETVDRYLGEGQGEMGMRRLREGLVLLNLPVMKVGEQGGDSGASGLGSRVVEERLFRSNESGREVLDELGLEVLSEAEARKVLERRVELGD